MIEVNDTVLKLTGPVTIQTHVALRNSAAPYIGKADWTIDWSSVTDVDSSALSLVFFWQRGAAAGGKTIRNLNFPGNLKALAELYGVADLVAAV